MPSHRPLRILCVWVTMVGIAAAQDAPAKPQTGGASKTQEKPSGKATRRQAPEHRHGPKLYMGRPIADVMTYLGADWLVRPEREQEEQPEAMLDALDLKPGDTVADVGAGVGYTSVRIAHRVGQNGTVYATDLQPQMITKLKENLTLLDLRNVRPVLCTATDPKLPEGKIDLALMVDVYHECSEPVATLQGLRKALKPGGRLVLVEFRGEDPEVPIKPEHKMTVTQVRKEIEPQGYTFKALHDFLPWQHIIIFEKSVADPAKPAGEAKKKAR